VVKDLVLVFINFSQMRTVFTLAFTLCLITGFSQDFEFPDYRSKKDLFTRIVEKDIRADVASFAFGGMDESVGKLPLKTIPVTAVSNNSISFAKDNIKVKITASAFDATKHKLAYFENKHLVKIDNRGYFGDYGKVPKTQIESITVVIDKDTVAIPAAAFADLYNPIFSYMENGVQKSLNTVYLSNDGRKVYVYMLKRETGGSYEATWVIQDKKYLKRVVDFGFLK
jgi:hypothetical protein